MAGAVAAADGEPWALFYNPAGLARLTRSAAGLDGLSSPDEVSHAALSMARPIARGGWGAAAGVTTVGGIERTRYDPASPDRFTTAGSVRAGDQYLAAAAGRRLSLDLDGGAAVTLMKEDLDDRSARTAAVSAGAAWEAGGGWRWGAVLKNAGPDAHFVDGRVPSPLRFQFGARYSVRSWGEGEADYSSAFRGGRELLLGGQWHGETERVFFRVGYRLRFPDDGLGRWNGATAGLGCRWGDFQADYALQPFGDVGTSQRMSLTWRWGREKARPPRPPVGRRRPMAY
jgi:hypothetical protein